MSFYLPKKFFRKKQRISHQDPVIQDHEGFQGRRQEGNMPLRGEAPVKGGLFCAGEQLFIVAIGIYIHCSLWKIDSSHLLRML